MGDLAVKAAKAKKQADEKPRDAYTHPHEKNALKKMQREAEEHGTTLTNGGKGGLPPSLVLGVMRRDDYQCKRCGGRENIGVHHKGGIVESKWLSKKGHKNDPNNIVTICDDCHNEIHEEAKSKGEDASQVKPEGDDYKGQHGHD